jgi:hypothetical protein
MGKFRTKKVREYHMRGAADWRGFVLEKSHDGATWSITPKLPGNDR